MATRQYIGARYVPKFYENSLGTSEWQAGVMYESLTIVTYNGNSYTSKKAVPANVGNPSANPFYWVATGMFNEQLSELTNKVNELESKTEGIDAPPVNILTLGAKNDGSEDVSSIINEYTNEYSLYFPIGIYRLDSPCTVRKNIIGAISARGGDTVLFDVQHNGNVFNADPNVGESEIVFENFVIEGNNIANHGINYIAAIRTFIDIESVDVLHCRGTAFNINPSAGSSRCARINNFIINGISDFTDISTSDYANCKGIYLASNVPDSEITNGQIMYCCIGAHFMCGNTRLSNTHIYCGQGGTGIDRAEWYSHTEGVDTSGTVTATDLYVDTCLQAFVQRAENSIITNFTYWDDGNYASTGNNTAVILSTRGTATIHVNNAVVGGNPTNISQVWGGAGHEVTIDNLINRFSSAYFNGDITPRKYNIYGCNSKDFTQKVHFANVTNEYYGEVCRISLVGSGYIEIALGVGSGVTKVSIRRSGSTWTVTKLSETFPLPWYYKVSGNYIIIFLQHSTTLDCNVKLTCVAGDLAGICDTVYCVNYSRTEQATSDGLTAITS